jgi:hypothetical protein
MRKRSTERSGRGNSIRRRLLGRLGAAYLLLCLRLSRIKLRNIDINQPLSWLCSSFGLEGLVLNGLVVNNKLVENMSELPPKYSSSRLKVPFGFRVYAKYSRVLIYSSSFHVWFSIRWVFKYRYLNTQYLNTLKSSNTLNPPPEDGWNTRN